MKTRAEILALIKKKKPLFRKRFKVHRIALFGSYARGDQSENSDVDIFVEVDPSIGLEFVSLADEIEKVLGLPVDLVSSRAVKPSHRRFIEKELIDV